MRSTIRTRRTYPFLGIVAATSNGCDTLIQLVVTIGLPLELQGFTRPRRLFVAVGGKATTFALCNLRRTCKIGHTHTLLTTHPHLHTLYIVARRTCVDATGWILDTRGCFIQTCRNIEYRIVHRILCFEATLAATLALCHETMWVAHTYTVSITGQ
jgi:hypothetical protein